MSMTELMHAPQGLQTLTLLPVYLLPKSNTWLSVAVLYLRAVLSPRTAWLEKDPDSDHLLPQPWEQYYHKINACVPPPFRASKRRSSLIHFFCRIFLDPGVSICIAEMLSKILLFSLLTTATLSWP